MAKEKSARKTKGLISQACAGKHDDQIALAVGWIPNVFIIGAPKSATTTLTSILQGHPEFSVSSNLEPNFFGKNYGRGWSWYKKNMGDNFIKGKYRCEASTMYSNIGRTYMRTPELISRCSPHAKIIYLARNPLDRMVSQWRHLRGRNHLKSNKKYLTPSFEKILDNKRLRDKLVGTSLYYSTLMRYRSFFAADQIHCMFFEDFTVNPKKSLQGLFEFFGTDPLTDKLLDTGERLPLVNQAGAKGRLLIEKPVWSTSLKKRVLSKVRDEADAFLAHLGKPSNFWTY